MSPVDWRERFQGSRWVTIQHTVAIMGLVRDAVSQIPLAGALVEILSGPPVFTARRDALATRPGWKELAERLDRRLTRSDGSYFFLDLPPGAYTLRAGAPQLGSRFGTVDLVVTVSDAREPNGRLRPARADAALPPTRLRGRVTFKKGAQQRPIAGATVRLRGDPAAVVLSDADGRYLLSRLVAGKPTIDVSAKGYKPLSRAANLQAGQEQILDLVLAPEA